MTNDIFAAMKICAYGYLLCIDDKRYKLRAYRDNAPYASARALDDAAASIYINVMMKSQLGARLRDVPGTAMTKVIAGRNVSAS